MKNARLEIEIERLLRDYFYSQDFDFSFAQRAREIAEYAAHQAQVFVNLNNSEFKPPQTPPDDVL